MAMMAKMRSLAPWFIITVGGLFVLFMVLSDSRITDILSQRSQEIGSVNGEEITYQQYSQFLEQYRQFQVQATGQEIPESQMEILRDNVWETLVSQKLVEMKIDELGLKVTDEEVKDALLGPNPPASVTQYFMDSLGRFNREAYEAAIYNPQNKEAVVQLEEQVRQQLLQEKLRNQINASVIVSDRETKQRFIDQNIKMNADYVLVNWSTIHDSLVNVTDSDIEKYYKQNKDEYKIEPQRKVKYVLFRKEASKGDSAAIKNNLLAIIDKLVSDTSSFKTYVEIYSQSPYSKDTVQVTQIPGEAQSAVVNAPVGTIINPIATSEGYVVYRIVNSFKSADEFVRASHILIPADPSNPAESPEATEIYNRLSAGEDFESLAREFSQDPGSAEKGGDLGWFGKGQMVKEFEDASFKGKIGEIQKPVKSQFGWHIIKVTGKSDKKYVVEKIVNKIEPSMSTLDKLYQDAQDFAYLAEKDGFEEVASQLGYNVIETTFFKEDTRAVPGLGSSKALVVFTFENKLNSISPVFNVAPGYTVVSISEIDKGGYKPLDDVKAAIRINLLREKKEAKALETAKIIREKIGSSGNLELAKDIESSAKVASVQNFSPNGSIPSLGREFAFSAKAVELNINEISDAFLGSRGAFIIRVTSRTEFDSTSYSLQKNSIRDNLLNQKKSRIFDQWIQSLKREAKIVDNRHIFYR